MNKSNQPQQIQLSNEQSVSNESKLGGTPQTAQINSESCPIRKNTQVSLDSKIWDNSYTLIYQAQQELLSDKLDQILKNHIGNRVQESFRRTNQQKSSAQQLSLQNCRESLQNTLRSQQNSIQELSILGNEFSVVENLIRDYRTELDLYQKQLQRQLTNKYKEVDFWKNQCNKISDRTQKDIAALKNYNFELQKKLIDMQYDNKIMKEQLKKNNKQGLSSSKSRKNIRNYFSKIDQQLVYLPDQQFSQVVQQQMEALVEALYSQLSAQKKIANQMKLQIFSLQKDIVESEKKIMKKNQVIHQLQIKILKIDRNCNQKNFSINNNAKISFAQENNQYVAQLSQRNNNIGRAEELQIYQPRQISQKVTPQIQNVIQNDYQVQHQLNLAELLQQQDLPRLQKLIIASKTIQLYRKKLQKKDYQILMPQNIIVLQCFPHFVQDLQRMEVKPMKNRHKNFQILNKERQQVLKQSLMYNLAFVLDSLFKQSNNLQNSSSTLSDILDSDIRGKIERILGERQQQKEKMFEELSSLLQNLSKLQKQQYL